MAITRVEPIAVSLLKFCEFEHTVPAVADFNVGTDYACYACIEHAKKKCENCEEPLKNDNVICKVFASNNKERIEYWCRDCDIVVRQIQCSIDTAIFIAGIRRHYE